MSDTTENLLEGLMPLDDYHAMCEAGQQLIDNAKAAADES
jgi:hypothetical protein